MFPHHITHIDKLCFSIFLFLAGWGLILVESFIWEKEGGDDSWRGWFMTTICDLWLIRPEVLMWERGWTPPSPLGFLRTPPPPHLGADLVGLEGRTCCTARQTIFRMTGFTFDRGLVKTNWQNKGQQINDPCSHPSPLDLDSVLPSPFLTFEFHTYNWTVRRYLNPHMHVHMHARAPERMHTLIP